jgi:hypothetical protein
MNENDLQNIRKKREIITVKKNLTTELHGVSRRREDSRTKTPWNANRRFDVPSVVYFSFSSLIYRFKKYSCVWRGCLGVRGVVSPAGGVAGAAPPRRGVAEARRAGARGEASPLIH